MRQRVARALSNRVYTALCNFLDLSEVQLWGAEQQENFKEDNLIATLYKDMVGLGYHALFSEISIWYGASEHSLRHNVRKVRRILKAWGEQQIKVLTLDKWRIDAASVPSKKNPENVNLLIDSTDFRLSGKRSTSRKEDSWSYKLNAPGQRYMIVASLRGRILKLWGGYSPKDHDGRWMQSHKEELDMLFQGGVLLGDCHFAWGKTGMSKVTVITPNQRRPCRKRKRGKEEPEEGVSALTVKQEEENKKLAALRAKVEHPFAWLDKKFKSLSQPWYETEEQMDCLVVLGLGIRNYQLTNNQ